MCRKVENVIKLNMFLAFLSQLLLLTMERGWMCLWFVMARSIKLEANGVPSNVFAGNATLLTAQDPPTFSGVPGIL